MGLICCLEATKEQPTAKLEFFIENYFLFLASLLRISDFQAPGYSFFFFFFWVFVTSHFCIIAVKSFFNQFMSWCCWALVVVIVLAYLPQFPSECLCGNITGHQIVKFHHPALSVEAFFPFCRQLSIHWFIFFPSPLLAYILKYCICLT